MRGFFIAAPVLEGLEKHEAGVADLEAVAGVGIEDEAFVAEGKLGEGAHGGE